MTGPVPPAGSHLTAAVVDGVDLDAVAAAARSCAAVDDLCPGAWGGVVSYLPGREVAGVRVTHDHVVISVRGRWGVPVSELAGQVRAAVTGLAGPRSQGWPGRGGWMSSWPIWPNPMPKTQLACPAKR